MDHDGSNVLSRSDLFETLFRVTQFLKILIERPSGRTELYTLTSLLFSTYEPKLLQVVFLDFGRQR